MSYEIQGKIIQKGDTEQKSEKFKKREFVIESERVVNTTMIFNDFVKFQLTQDRCDLVETFQVGDMVKVNFDIRGNKWEKNGETVYFTNLEAWRIEKVQAQDPEMAAAPMETVDQIPPPPPQNAMSVEEDDLPF